MLSMDEIMDMNDDDMFKEYNANHKEVLLMNLECSSKGDKRFSAFYAKAIVSGKVDSIENHYQSVKFKKGVHLKALCIPCKKGEKVDKMIFGGKVLEPKYLTPYYTLLWIKYLDANPELVAYAKTFDTYSDMFKGKAINCQADIVRKYCKDGRISLMKECAEFLKLFK